MAYEQTSINVVNHYGPRGTGRTKGVLPSVGAESQFSVNFDGEADPRQFKFPVGVKCYVTGVVTAGATGTVSACTVGGVAVLAATEAAPVVIPANNTGVVVVTGATAGTVLIKYLKYIG